MDIWNYAQGDPPDIKMWCHSCDRLVPEELMEDDDTCITCFKKRDRGGYMTKNVNSIESQKAVSDFMAVYLGKEICNLKPNSKLMDRLDNVETFCGNCLQMAATKYDNGKTLRVVCRCKKNLVENRESGWFIDNYPNKGVLPIKWNYANKDSRGEQCKHFYDQREWI